MNELLWSSIFRYHNVLRFEVLGMQRSKNLLTDEASLHARRYKEAHKTAKGSLAGL